MHLNCAYYFGKYTHKIVLSGEANGDDIFHFLNAFRLIDSPQNHMKYLTRTGNLLCSVLRTDTYSDS